MDKNIDAIDEAIILFVDSLNRPVGPTEIGLCVLQKPYSQASSAVMGRIKKLVKRGILVRRDGGKYELQHDG